MNKLTARLLATTFGALSFTLMTHTISYAQDNTDNPPNGGPNPAQQPGSRPYGGPESQDGAPPRGWRGGQPGQGDPNFSGQPGQNGPGEGPPGGPGPRGQWSDSGQNPGAFAGGRHGQWAGAGGGQGMSPEQREQRRQRMLKMFDKNGDGKLDDNERAEMRAYMEKRREQPMEREGQGGGFNNGQFPGPGGGQPQ